MRSGAALSGGKGWDALGGALIGMYAGYVLGSSFGVYTIAESGKDNVTFSESIGGGIIGSLAGIAFFALSRQSAIGGAALFALPTVGSILMVELD